MIMCLTFCKPMRFSNSFFNTDYEDNLATLRMCVPLFEKYLKQTHLFKNTIKIKQRRLVFCPSISIGFCSFTLHPINNFNERNLMKPLVKIFQVKAKNKR